MIRFLPVLLFCIPLAATAQGQLNLYCSSPNTAWCQGMAVGFEKATGTRVSVVQKATGEMFAQVKAEAANPKGDVWWAGPADAYLQAAE
ncbi:MAG TPA: iron ABC transporter substrate-binding protein, partial [Casimicrobiaceae bacterium]|nr:iron ABC transporter substrate-binding protein [Casimicrobiaceae bacterium]